MLSRRQFIRRGAQVSVATATTSLWGSAFGMQAFAQMAGSPYKAVVVVSMRGGNDANNMIVPLDNAGYAAYTQTRGVLALPIASLIPLQSSGTAAIYGLHPAMPNIAALYNARQASVVANVGPLIQPVTKAQLNVPTPGLFSHPSAIAEWESSSGSSSSATGWGGRIADVIAGQSGSLPPVLNAGLQSLFTVGNQVQAVAVQGGTAFAATIPPALNQVVLQMSQADSSASNLLVSALAKLRVDSLQQQTLIDQASTYKTLQTAFPPTPFGATMQKIAQIIGGNNVIGASRQLFYAQQGSYDTHVGQLATQSSSLSELDSGIGAFIAALNELGLTDQVLVCTHSEFNRTYTPNVAAGSDHGWGNHQLLFGGGLLGGRVLGTMPTLEVGGPDDYNTLGIWIPTTSVTQLTSGIGTWMGLNSSQLASVFPDLGNFPEGSLKLS